MMPQFRSFFARNAVVLLLAAQLPACSSTAIRSGEVLEPDVVDEEPQRPKLVGDYCQPWGDHYMPVQGIALVTGLQGTGSDPPPGGPRERILAEMRRLEVPNSNAVLASPNTSLVAVRVFLPPAARKGDRLDVEVRLPEDSDTTSLERGWLMETRLEEMAVLGNQVRTGHVGGMAQGPVVVDALWGEAEPVDWVRGKVLGGATVTQNRVLGLIINEQHHSVQVSATIGAAINRRFHTYDAGRRRGAAVPKKDTYVELDVHPHYRHNINRYLRVVENIPMRDDAALRDGWLEQLEPQLLARETSAHAALQLEAIGERAIAVLNRGLQSRDPEVRFYSAEALAYLDQPQAAEHLLEAAREESAFRWHALTALSTMSDLAAHDALTELLNVPSAETRYGTFRALQAMNPHDPLVRPTPLGDVLLWHEVSSRAEPLLHVARSRRPEIVLFGGPVRLGTFAALFAGKNIMLKPAGTDRIQISRYQVGSDPTVRTTSNDLREVIDTVVDLGATYSDVVQLLMEADRPSSNQVRALSCRLAFDALPRPGRTYIRKDLLEGEEGEGLEATEGLFDEEPGTEDSDAEPLPLPRGTLPLPDMFAAPSERERELADRQQQRSELE